MESACLPPQELAGYGASGPLLDPGRGLTPSLGERCDRCFGSGSTIRWNVFQEPFTKCPDGGLGAIGDGNFRKKPLQMMSYGLGTDV